MKKSILFGVCFVLLSCSKTDKEESASPKLLLRGTQPTTMRYKLISNMIQNYRTNQLQSIQNSGTNAVSNDAQAIWFDIETLKKFIADVESQTSSNSQNTVNNLGIRFYYAAYPEKNKWGTTGYEELSDLSNPVTQLYEKKHTLIMIPTINVNGVDRDFNPLDINTYKGFNSVTNNNSNYQIMSGSNNALSTSARNHGILYPPGNTIGNIFN